MMDYNIILKTKTLNELKTQPNPHNVLNIPHVHTYFRRTLIKFRYIVDLNKRLFGRCPMRNQLIIEHVPLSLLPNHRWYNISLHFSDGIESVYSSYETELKLKKPNFWIRKVNYKINKNLFWRNIHMIL